MTIQELHNSAMIDAEHAFLARFKGDDDSALEYFEKAYIAEKDAAFKAKSAFMEEPTLTVLFKSAASLALNAKRLEDAEKLVCLALSGNPPLELAEELRDLFENINFQRHLKLKGIQLSPNEVQLVLAGPGIAFGMADSNIVLDKITTFEQLAVRTAERMSGKDFRKAGKAADDIRLKLRPFLSVPRAASFALTLRFGELQNQIEIQGLETSTFIISDVIDNITLINEAKHEELESKIQDPIYLGNFVSLVKELAPDGQSLNLVGFTMTDGKESRDVQFTRTRNEINLESFTTLLENTKTVAEKYIKLTGRLVAANDIKSSLTLESEGEGNYTINVPDGLSDIVKKYWGEFVSIKGNLIKHKTIELKDIDPL